MEKGFATAQKRDKLGVCGSNTCEPVFQGCEVAAGNVPGGVNEGVCGPMSGLDDERAGRPAGHSSPKFRQHDWFVENHISIARRETSASHH